MLTDIVSYDKADDADPFNLLVRNKYQFKMSGTLKAYCKHIPGCITLKILIICSLILHTSYSFAQPVWTASPTVTAPHSTKIDVSYTIDQNSTVYYFGLDYNYGGTFTGEQVKTFALAGPSGQRVCAGSVSYSTPGSPASLTFTNFPANTQVTLFMVAESNPGALLQVTSIKLSASTLPCVTPDYLSGFSQSVVCVNKGASATIMINLLSMDPDVNGILSGTNWVLDWGDGTAPTNYTSTADNDLPPAGLRTHAYSSVTNCNYIFSCSVINPCGSFKQDKYVAVVHGRDLPADGDGLLALVDNATGSNIITVCAGTQSVVTIRDNSIWNCQNPTVEEPFVAIPNNDQRNIEWLYGRDPSGAIMNTITGAVTISALGNAPASSSRITPTPYGPSSISEVITIPATCQPGEYFRVYLKNWNKCNWTDPEAIETFIDITVADSPLAPTISNVTICGTTSQTLTVTSPVTGLLNWYSDALKTTLVYTGGIGENTYTPSLPIPSTTTFYVAEQQITGNLCEGPATPVTITIYGAVSSNMISASQTICSNSVPAGLTGTLPAGGDGSYLYLWQSSTTGAGGPWSPSAGINNNQNYTPTIPLTQDTWYRRVVTSGPCTDYSVAINITVNPLPAITNMPATSCSGVPFTVTPTNGINGVVPPGTTYSWSAPAVTGGITGGAASAGYQASISGTLINPDNIPQTATYIVTPLSGVCTGSVFTVTVTVNPQPTLATLSNTVCSDNVSGITLSVAGGSVAALTYNIVAINNGGLTTSSGSPSTGIGFAANVILDDAWTNKTGANVNVVYSVIPVSGSGCLGNSSTVTLTVNPEPVLALLNTTRCSDDVLGFNLSVAGGSTPAAVYNITSINANGLTASAGLPATGAGLAANVIADDAWTNKTAVPVNVVYTVQPVGVNSCFGDPYTVTITVNPEPQLATLDATRCSNEALGFNLGVAGGSVAASTYNITAIDNGGLTASAGSPSTGVGLAANVISDDAWTNSTTSVNVVYTVVPVSASGCIGDPKTITITVNPLPATSPISGDAIICQNATNKVYSVTNHPGSSYSWTVPSSLTITSPTNLNFLIVDAVPGQSQTGDKITVEETITSTGCTGPLIEFPIEVSEIFSPETIAGPTLECQGASGLTYSVTNHSGSTYSWTVPSGANITSDPGLNTITVGFPLTVSGNITVSETNGACITNHIPLTVTINPLPVPTVSGPQTLRITAAGITYTTESSMTGYSWTISPGGTITGGSGTNSITVSWNSVGNQTVGINYTNSFNCTGTGPANYPVNIYPLPSVDNVHITGTASAGSVLTGNYNYYDRGVGSEGASTYKWFRNGTLVGTSLTYTISAADINKSLIFEVTPVSTMGTPYSGMPGSSAPINIEDPTEIPVVSEVCIEGIRETGKWIRGKYRYTHSLPEGASLYQWYRGGSPISGATTAFYMLTATDISGNEEITFKVTPVSSNTIPNVGSPVTSNPLGRITLPQDSYSVAISSVALTANSVQGVFSGSYVMNGIFSPKQAGVGGPYNILYFTSIVNTVVTCFQQASANLMVTPNETLFTGFDSVYCKDGGTDVISISGAPPGATSLGFTLSDPDAIISQTEWSVTIDPSKINAGIKKDILTFQYNYGGYDYFITHPFKVDSVGSVIQIVNLNSAYCSNSPKQGIYVSGVYPLGGTGNWTGSILSDINGTSASIDPSLGTAGMTFPVTYQYTSPLGCKSNLISGNIEINQAPSSPSVSAIDPLTLCLGDSATLQVDEIPGYNYQWKRDSKNTGNNSSSFEAKLAGNYSVVVSDSRGCTATSSNSITITDVNSLITTTFRVNGPVSFCQGGSVTMSVTNNPDYIFQWTRDGSDITNETFNFYTAQTTGVYALKVTNSSGCRNKTEDISVTVSAMPEVPLINAAGNLEFCQGDSVVLSVGSIPGYSYHWKLNNVAIGSDKNSLSAKNSGTYTLTVSNSAGCSVVSYNSVPVTVHPIPAVQQLSLNGPSTFCQGSSVVLSVARNESNTYQWLKNGINVDDSTSNSFAAREPGTYSLIIMNAGGCTFRPGDAILNVLEAPVAPAITSVGPLELCIGDSTVMSFTNTYGYSCRWFRNGSVFANGVTSVTAKSAGKYSLVVTNEAGCSTSAANTIDLKDVNSQVTTTFRVNGPTEFCKGNTIGLSVSYNPDYYYQWMKDNINIPGANTNSYTAAVSGTYFLHVMNSAGCKNKTEDIRVIVYPNPDQPLINADGLLETCEGDSVILSVEDIQDYSYQWKLNGGAVGANSSRHISRNSGNYTILVSNIYGCSVQSVNSIEALFHPLPLVSTISQIGNDTKFCQGESISLSVPLNTSYKYAWKNHSSIIPDASSNLFTARESGKYTVEVTSESGCTKIPEAVDIEVVEMPVAPSIDPGVYYPKMCLNENYLKLSVKDTVSHYTYRWVRNGTPISTAKSIYIQDEGTYYLDASFDICTSEHDSLIVEFNENTLPKPDITAHGPTIWYLNTSSDADYFKWSFNGDIIPGAENRYYIAHQNYGIYRVGVSNDRDCYSFSDTIRIPLGTTGVEETYPFENIKIYPNPARNIITVEMDNFVFGRLRIEVLSQNGSKIINHEFDKSASFFSGKIDLSGWPTGLYFINISAENYYTTRKIILE